MSDLDLIIQIDKKILTNHIERFNNTLRQRISRLVRQTLSFSKKIQNHIGALLLFINHYNKSLRFRPSADDTPSPRLIFLLHFHEIAPFPAV